MCGVTGEPWRRGLMLANRIMHASSSVSDETEK